MAAGNSARIRNANRRALVYQLIPQIVVVRDLAQQSLGQVHVRLHFINDEVPRFERRDNLRVVVDVRWK